MVVPTKQNESIQRQKWKRATASLAVILLLSLFPQSERFEVQELTTELLLGSHPSSILSANADGERETVMQQTPSVTSSDPAASSSQPKQPEDLTSTQENLQSEGQGWRNTMPIANFTATPDTQYEMCFVTSVYSSSIQQADRPPSVQTIQDQNPSFRFFAFTNLPELKAPGWKVVVKHLSQYKRHITASRWAKFMAWEDPEISLCQAVIYMDGFCRPKEKHAERYKRMAKAIHDSPEGLLQNRHEVDKGPLHELNRILVKRKDIRPNVEASKAWLEQQPDFDANLPMYVNTFIGYNPKSDKFRQVAQFFWDRYSLEVDSWRDQPLWSYSLHKHKVHPKKLGTYKALFQQIFRNMARGGHRYNKGADSDAHKSLGTS